ncbi:hypothetical protein MRY82_00120 [bacterium]|nr:hypothetical protein [bacterium]
MSEKACWVEYSGSKIWLLVFALLYFPLAIFLILLKGKLHVHQGSYYFDYTGSVFWLGFWLLVFFPIGLLLVLINGISFKQFNGQTHRSVSSETIEF